MAQRRAATEVAAQGAADAAARSARQSPPPGLPPRDAWAQEHLARAFRLHQAGALAQAEAGYRSVLVGRAPDPEVLHLLGVCLQQQGRAEAALPLLAESVRLRPQAVMAHLSLAEAQRLLRRFEDSLASCRLAARLYPTNMLAPLGAGMALEELERYPEALAAYDRALELQPGSFEALYGRANALLMGGRVEASVAAFDRVLAIRPRHQGAGGNRIAALIRLGRLEEALASLEELVPVYPADAGLHANRGAMLQLLGRHSEAVDSLQRALALQPAMGAAWLNLGVAQMALNQYEDALQSLDRLIAIQPRNAEAHNYRAMVRLVQGQYEDAWPDFEWREAGTRGRSGSPLAARWLGRVDDRRDLRGVSIQVHHEQGHGDTIHFLRYVKLLQARGARVQLRVQPALASLVQRCIGAEPWDEEAAQGADFQSPLLSLPYAFGTTPASIPASLPYLWADEQRVHRWREHLRSGGQLGAWPGGPSEGPPTVGLAWSGSAHNVADRRRSLSPARLAPLLQDGLRFLALQPDLRPGDREQLDALRAIELFGPLIEDFEDTAALIAQCDLVISVDTAVAHLAGAMGKPVWILLPYSPDWRWMLEREDSPWYPGSRLFRQREPGDWDSALAAAAAALAGFVSASSGSSN